MNKEHYFKDGRWHHTWHQSDLKTLDMGPERAHLMWSGAVQDVEGDAAVLGTACHNAVEQLIKPLYPGATPVHGDESHFELHEAFGHHLDDLVPTITHWNSYKSKADLFKLGTIKLDSWYEQVYPLLHPIDVEVGFDQVLFEDDERVVRMTGRIDLIDDGLGLVDWKFPKRDYTREKWQYERWDPQSTTYCWATGRTEMTFYVMYGAQGEVSSMTIERGPQDFEFLRRKVEAASRLVEQSGLKVWPLNDAGWWCSEKWAPCWSVCKGKTTALENANG
jgi:hypothetical protein